MGHALRAALHSDPASAVVRIDFANAFNTLSRSRMLSAVARRRPDMLPYVGWLYGAHSNLLVEGAPADAAPVSSQRGVRQDDPLGPFLFGLTLQGALEQVDAAALEGQVLALHDDVTLHGRVDALVTMDRVLRSSSEALGLSRARHKCAVYSPDPATRSRAARALDLPEARDGVVVAGSPVGTSSFV
jgi:hypothetical protein